MTMHSYRNARGFSLIEVMIAVIVLAVGLLSLAALQGELFRSGAEAKARANAATIAQQVIEDARTFGFTVAPDVDYVGNTYSSLVTDEWDVLDVSGIDFNVDREVIRYRYDEATGTFAENAVDPFSIGVPEFKMVRVNVSWTSATGEEKSIQMADSIAAISPADVAKVMEGPSESAQGPTVWIEPPNKDNPRAVPIAVGDNQSAASSNPTPEQFIEDVSAVTKFSVLSFTGSIDGDEVQLTRKLDMAAASCVCQEGGSSTSTNPAYEPTVWNGVQLAYQEPGTVPIGTATGTAIVANADSEIEPICTICCRDHHVDDDRSPAPDPWRAEQGDSVADHYGYGTQGNSYDIGGGLLPTSDTDGLYLDACQLTRVAGRMRMMVDASQASLVTTPLDDAGTGYRIADFITHYSGYVTTHLAEALGADAEMPTGYPSPTAKFPAPSTTTNTAYAVVVDPDAVEIAEDETVNLVSFGLYVDYLNEDTLLAYRCALNGTDEDDECTGLIDRDPLTVLPFYAVNVASLGDWDSAEPLVVSVAGATYTNQGALSTIGGIVVGGKAASETDGDGEPIPSPVTITINNSNSGLTGTAAVDLDDELDANYIPDAQTFVKTDGSVGGSTNVLTVNTIASSTLKVNAFNITFEALCNYSNQDKLSSCDFESPMAGTVTLTIANYNGLTGGKTPTVIDRKVCFPTHAKLGTPNPQDIGLSTEYTTIDVTNLGSVDYAMLISVVAQADACPATGLSMTP